MPISEEVKNTFQSVNQAFSRQATHYDVDDMANPILQQWRSRVYTHVERYLIPHSRILELNAGTGIDATYLVKKGHSVHATDISDGMIAQIELKVLNEIDLNGRLTCEKCSFTDLSSVKESCFDYIYSNFGGLNCADDLTKVTEHFSGLLSSGGYVTLVIMPKMTPWEWSWILKGQLTKAFRRWKKNGVSAHLEGEFFQTYYFSLGEVAKSLGEDFQFIKCENLGLISPPPGSLGFYHRFTRIARFLEKCDRNISTTPLFNRWGDHIICTFQYLPTSK